MVEKKSFSRNDNHLHLRTFSFQQKTFNNTICMRTDIQLHYYATISMKVTILNVVRHTLPCFHLTVKRKQSLISVILLNRDISPNFPRKFDYRTRDHMYFFQIIISQSSPCRYKFGHLRNFLRTTQRAHYSIRVTYTVVIVRFVQKCHEEIESHLNTAKG